MKRYLAIFASIVLLILSSCNKADDVTTGTLAANTWEVGTTIYTAAKIYRNTTATSLVMEDAPGGSQVDQLFFGFSTFPTVSGTYSIVGTNTLAGNQMSVAALLHNNGVESLYKIFEDVAPTAYVTVTNGKISISFTDFWAKKLGSTDSLQVSASVTEP